MTEQYLRKKLNLGERVTVSREAGWENDCEGIIASEPELVKIAEGEDYWYFVAFDIPQHDLSSDGPYSKAQILSKYLTTHFVYGDPPEDWEKYKRETFEQRKHEFKPGDIYLDVFGHPTVCLLVTIEDNDRDISLEGVSLLDATYPRSCSVVHSAPEKITYAQAWDMKICYEQKRPKIKS